MSANLNKQQVISKRLYEPQFLGPPDGWQSSRRTQPGPAFHWLLLSTRCPVDPTRRSVLHPMGAPPGELSSVCGPRGRGRQVKGSTCLAVSATSPASDLIGSTAPEEECCDWLEKDRREEWLCVSSSLSAFRAFFLR